jgi:hypothetical protein
MTSLPCRYVFVLSTFCRSVLLYVDRICLLAAKDQIIGFRVGEEVRS